MLEAPKFDFNAALEKRFREKGKNFAVVKRFFGRHHDQEDAIQEGFLAALTYRDQYDPKRGTFDSWVNRVLSNAAIAMARVNYRRNEEPDEGLDVADVPQLDYLVFRLDVKRAISEGSYKRPEILVGYFLEGSKPNEIANDLSVNIHTVRQTIKRFKKDHPGIDFPN